MKLSAPSYDYLAFSTNIMEFKHLRQNLHNRVLKCNLQTLERMLQWSFAPLRRLEYRCAECNVSHVCVQCVCAHVRRACVGGVLRRPSVLHKA